MTTTTFEAAGPPVPRVRRRPRTSAGVLGAAGLLTLVLLVEALPRTGIVDERFLPPFSTIVSALVEQVQNPASWEALLTTLRGWATGLAIAMAAGVVLGIVIGTVPLLRAATSSTIEFLRPIPSGAVATMYALVVVTGLIGVVVNLLARAGERRVLRWHPSVRGEVPQ